MKKLVFHLILTASLCPSSIFAQDTVADDTGTAPQPAAAVEPAALPLTQTAHEQQFADKTEVEGLVGAQLGDEYYRWTVRGKYTYPTFRGYMYDRYRGSKRSGIVLMTVMGTIGIALMAASSVMFVNAETCDYLHGYSSPEVCWNDEDWVAGGAAMIATGATILAIFVAVGIFKIVKSTRRMRILGTPSDRQQRIAFEGVGLSWSQARGLNGAHLTFAF